MSEIIYLSKVRLSFPKLLEAHASQEGAAKKFGADLIMAPSDTGFATFMGEVGKMAQEKWKDNGQAVLLMVQNDRKLRCYGSGQEKINKKTFKPYSGYEGMVYVSASSNEDRPPQIIRLDGTAVDPSNTMERLAVGRKLYGGCYVNAAVRPWPQDNQYGRAVRCELVAVQFCCEGEPFGEGDPDVSGMFGAVAGAAPAAGPLGSGVPMPPVPFPAFFGAPHP